MCTYTLYQLIGPGPTLNLKVPEGIFKKTLERLLQLNPGKAPRYHSDECQINVCNNQRYENHLAFL